MANSSELLKDKPTINNKRNDLLNILCQLNENNPVDCPDDVNELCASNLKATGELQRGLEESYPLEFPLKKYNPNDDSDLWKYINLNIHYLLLLEAVSKKDPSLECLSVQQTKDLKNIFRNVIGVGIASNLLPNIPHYIKLPSEENTLEKPDIYTRYRRLTGTTYGIYLCFQCNQLKPLIIPNIKWVLSSFYQLIFAPLKKPSSVPSEDGFIMTASIYRSLMYDKQEFKNFLKQISSSLHPRLYIRETMMLTGTFSSEHKALVAPQWFRLGVFSTLEEILRGAKGVENVTWALLDAAGLDSSDDSAKSWKALDIIGKMILSNCKRDAFRVNICNQLIDLLKLRDKSGRAIKPFERLFSLTAKLLFQQDEALCREMFIKHLLKPLVCFTNEKDNYFADNEDVTECILQNVRLLRSLFVERSFNLALLPIKMLNDALNSLYYIYSVTFDNDNFKGLAEDLKLIIMKYLKGINSQTDKQCLFFLFDNFLFGIPNEKFSQQNLQLVTKSDRLIMKHCVF